MKKVLSVLAVLAFAGCSNDVFVEEIEKQDVKDVEIGFNTFTSKQTRAENSSATAEDALEAYNTTFKVWGYKYVGSTLTESEVFGGVVVTHQDADATAIPAVLEGWTYSPVRFWDKSATSYSFYAASPSALSWVWDADNYKLSLSDFALDGENRVDVLGVSTSIATDAVMADVDTKDLMISTDLTGYINFTTTKVNLHFNHILSRLNIGVRKGEVLDGFTVKLNSLKVYNMTSNGSFDEADASSTSNPALNAGTIARWSAATTPASFTAGQMKYAPSDALEITSTSSDASSNYQYVYQGLVIPQAVAYSKTVLVNEDVTGLSSYLKLDGTNADASSNPYIVIDYSIFDGTTKIDDCVHYYNLADVFNGDTENAVNFCEGWQNTLKITISPVAIEFDADVYEWADKTSVEVTVD